ncbi:MAG: histidine kinase [Rhizobiales bacterium 63-7]|nr:MAG: histidine kinase [Rhizobiales bacterium 63-7]
MRRSKSSFHVEGRRQAFEANAWLASVIENSNDAIVTKTLEGIIMTWNRGAERLFGYSAADVVGKPITILIPDDRLSEEDEILSRLRAGDRIDHFETVRRRKDGEPVQISVTISPVRDEAGRILGASKIARDIGAQQSAHARQLLLLREMNHRIKNLFTLIAGLVRLSSRATKGGEALANELTGRLQALARAHELTLPYLSGEADVANSTDVRTLLTSILLPHDDEIEKRISVTGVHLPLCGNALTSVALLFHELATNAAKYGALSNDTGKLKVSICERDSQLHILWIETTDTLSPPVDRREGFGSTLERAALQGIDGSLTREWLNDGLKITFSAPLRSLVV